MIKLFFAVVMCLCTVVAFPQQRPQHSPFNFIPPSPDAASLGKYGQIGTDKSSGLPQIGVPLYEIKTSRLSAPISLSYNASGVKVDEIAGWTGLSWSLNAGGVITRTIVGLPDENPGGFLNQEIPNPDQITFPDDRPFLDGVMYGSRDTEPDYFFYNFGEFAGKFVFGEDKTPVEITSSSLRIEFVPSNYSFKITNGSGDIYLFQNKESVTSGQYYEGGSMNTVTGTSSWYLTSIVSADRSDTIKFSYRQEQNTLYEYSYSYMQVLGPKTDLTPGTPCASLAPTLDGEDLQQGYRSYQPLRLSSIQYAGGKIEVQATAGARTDNGCDRLDAIVVYACVGNSCKVIKSFKLKTDYFYSSAKNTVNPQTWLGYRLKLIGVHEIDRDGTVIKEHSFVYDDMPPPPVNNFAQDQWGYYNGQTNNQTLLQRQSVVDETSGVPFNIGSADRSFSDQHVRAGSLKRIYYPTRGYTEFTYGAHKYYGPGSSVASQQKSVNAVGDMRPLDTITYVPTTGTHSVNVKLRRIGGLTGLTDRPIVYIRNKRTMQNVYAFPADPDRDIDITTSIGLQPGEKYLLYAKAEGNPLVYASLTLYYDYRIVSSLEQGGGLRIEKISNYDADGKLIDMERFTYGENESGVGEVLSTRDALFRNRINRRYSYGRTSGGVGCSQCINTRTQYSSNRIYELSNLRGSDIGYRYITVYKDADGKNYGKTTFEYDLYPDEAMPVLPDYNNGMFFLSYAWRSGLPKSETYWKWTGDKYNIVKKKQIEYTSILGRPIRGMKIGYKYVFIGCASIFPNDFYYFDYPIPAGIKLPNKITETIFDPENPFSKVETVTNLYYANTQNYQPTRTVTEGSDGSIVEKLTSFPGDMVVAGRDPSGIYAAMAARNIVIPQIEQVELRDGTQTLLKRMNYFSPFSHIYVPQSAISKIGNNTEENDELYTSYDTKGNMTGRTREGGYPTSYLWGNRTGSLLAEVKNAEVAEVAYAGFEDDENDSWSYDYGSRIKNATYWGEYYFSLGNRTLVKNGLSSSKVYVVSYHRRTTGAVNVSGTQKTTTGVSRGGWVYEEKEITGVTSVTISGSGTVDEVRLAPKGALVATFTYQLGVGQTSTTDSNGISTFYEYDTLGRLHLIKDNDGNIVKRFTYNYQIR